VAVTIFDLYNALGLTQENGTQTLINSIRNSTELRNMTNIWDGTVTGLQDFGVAVNQNSKTQNSFLNELIDRIGIVVLEQADLRNPLKVFKKGTMMFGRSVQEIFTDLIKAQSFNPADAEETLFKRNPPATKVLFHDTWRKELYKTTIEEEELQHAFVSIERFQSFITTIYNALYNSNEVDEYIWTKATLESYIARGFAGRYVSVDAITDQATVQDFLKLARAHYRLLTLPQGSRDYNASGVWTRTPSDRLWIMISAELEASVSVDALAYAFNMDRADFLGRVIIIDRFAIPGLQAVMFDENIFKIYDKEFKMRTVENGQGLYWNINLHVHQLFSMSKFCNIVAFMSEGIPNIRRMTLTPLSKTMQLGTSAMFSGIINSMDANTVISALAVQHGTPVAGVQAVVTGPTPDSINGIYQVEVTLPAPGTPEADAIINEDLQIVVEAVNAGFSRSQIIALSVIPAVEP
jgi:hypothetical protein